MNLRIPWWRVKAPGQVSFALGGNRPPAAGSPAAAKPGRALHLGARSRAPCGLTGEKPKCKSSFGMDLSELRTTAELAQLELDEAELERLGTAVEQMVVYFSKMSEIDVDSLSPTTHALLSRNRTRSDQVLADEPDRRRSTPDQLLENATDLEDRFIVIPNVL